MRQRRRVGLVVVTCCAVVVSFSGLYDLAIAVGFSPVLAALVPVLADAGGALAADVWLDRDVPRGVRRYAACIALALIASSVLGNGAAHLLAVLAVPPPWWLVVLVAGLAPAVVASNLHLSALVKAGGEPVADEPAERQGETADESQAAVPDSDAGESPAAEEAEPPQVAPPRLAIAGEPVAERDHDGRDEATDGGGDVLERAREMAAAGVGRPTLVKELGIKDHVAKAIVAEHKPRQEAPA